ncbi:hypothetical protein ANME2D_00167 [Candidatus Methanoperedens nitroreducens]|uniref:Uncharacterized protein n=1 Tax=Candidatus Methanoperedens nitratireducens TaxID=1392998 RepID=A0A062V990_9EURY|nr:hypothetical protein [Candidatus Methanoperedens nitroreducens]KCZ73108.1 hypothetical protein ANME2D_00167 [Candidatus Methanoperedens nitroreducens]MDJ1422946.1 hypothetical protein [Candidatus Methanoperedens sp.]
MNLIISEPEKKIKELRIKVKETTERELIREALRARSFSGIETLRQGMNLIDFALRAKKVMHANNR